MTSNDIRTLDREHIIYSWKAGRDVQPLVVDRAKGVFLWDPEGRRYIDFCAGLLNVNIGHGHPHVLDAMRAQMEKVCFVSPAMTTEAKATLGKMIAEVTPGELNYAFFTNGGAEAIENAIKAARWFTGRHKIYSRWRSYHGATAGAMTLSGDPRRWPAEPGIPGVVHYFGPYPYRCPFGGADAEESSRRALEVLRTQVMLDGPESIAAIFLEPITGTNGILIPTRTFVQGVRQLCDEIGALMVVDEVMSGWGRSGTWFCVEHFDVVPDILVTAKGLTSGYVPLGAMIWSRRIWEHFWDHPFTGGLTYGGHALACATAIANIEVYRQERLIEESARKGLLMGQHLERIKANHPSVGDVRNKGLWGCIELVADKTTKEPLAGFADAKQNVMTGLMQHLLGKGVCLFAKWDFIFLSPPLCISDDELAEAMQIIDEALAMTDAIAAGCASSQPA